MALLFTLKGLKPCFPFSPGSGIDKAKGDGIMNNLVKTAFMPVMHEHNLDDYGFTLRKVDHHVRLSPDIGAIYQNQWFFADVRSDRWPLVKSVFFSPQNSEVFPLSAVSKAFGYPIVSDDDKVGDILYLDSTEKDFLQKHRSPVEHKINVALIYRAPGGKKDCKAIFAHFATYRDAAASVGHKLVISTCDHPVADMECSDTDPTLPDAFASGRKRRRRTGTGTGAGVGRGGRRSRKNSKRASVGKKGSAGS
jgi:hypothetical protein